MKYYDRSTLKEEPLPGTAKPISQILDAEDEQRRQHRYSLRCEK